MRTQVLVLALNVAAVAAMFTWELPREGLSDLVSVELDDRWTVYKKSHNKTYDGLQEELMRRTYWEDNVRYIDDHNKKYERGESTFFLRENHISDLSEDEYEKIYNTGLIVPEEGTEYYPEALTEPNPEAPSSVDWRKSGIVSPIRNQGHCGSCWAFAALAALESIAARKQRRKTPVRLSEQNLVDCTRSYGNWGCRGGWMNNAFKYMKTLRGVNTNRCYPYAGRDQRCSYRTTSSCIGPRVTGYRNVGKSSHSLDDALYKAGPVSFAMDTNHRSFGQYGGGVYYEPRCNSNRATHAMALVGYTNGYYIIKNSWSTRWGEKGYMRINKSSDRCGVTKYASYPTV